jgi:putative membrane protein
MSKTGHHHHEYEKDKNYKIINALSIAIPIAVAAILGIRTKIDLGAWTKGLPHLIAIINSLTSICLIIGFIAIKKHNVILHQRMMKSAFLLGGVFLITYILYHISNPSTHFGGEGYLKYVYFFVLISHIILSIGVVPFVLYAIYYAMTGHIHKHVQTVKWTFPLWLYVSVTGVIAYLMIKPYYV